MVSLRICSGPVERDAAGVELPGIVPHADALTTGVDAVLDTLAGLPEVEADADGFCDADWRSPIHYVVGYADGTTRSVTTEYAGCHDLELGAGRPRQDPAAFLQAVGDALLAQRAGRAPPTT